MASTTPEGLEIRPRHLDFDLPDPMPRHWHSGDAFKTHMFNAMSVLFPDGERFFIDSVRHYRERVEDPALKQQIRGFIGQEGHHSREHLVYSDRLRALGYDIDRLEGGAKRRIRFAQQKLHPSRQLAATAALEHLTAIMADGLLSNPRWLEGADPTMARLWRWHALEETEHKAVAYDVFMLVNGKARLRRRAMVQGTFFFALDTTKGLVHMLKRDGLLWNFKVWRDGIKWLWGKDGVFRSLVGVYLDFYKKDFHPWQHNNQHLIEQYRDQFEPEPKAA